MTTTKTVEWTVGGDTFEGLLAMPDGAPKGVILVCHAWSGRADHEEEVAKRLAELGYAAMAGDVYGKGVRGSSVEENQKLMNPLVEDRRGKLRDRLKASLDALKAETGGGNVLAVGYCFGGLCVLDMARANMDVAGSAAFHAILGEDGKPGEGDIGPKVLAMQGADDPMATQDDRTAFAKEMTGRNADWQLHTFGGVQHAFTNKGANDPDLGTVYDAQADKRSWRLFTDFLAETLS